MAKALTMPFMSLSERLQSSDAPPPSYIAATQQSTTSVSLNPDEKLPAPTERALDQENSRASRSSRSDIRIPVSNSAGLPLPVVIPQTTKSFRGAFVSPFVRAWVPELQSHGFDQQDFLTFIDGLNEAWVNHPIFEGLGLVGGVMGMVHGVHPVQIAGGAIQLATGLAGAATSIVRSKAYVKAVNANLFHPAGLHATVLTTKKMVAEVGYPEERLRLPPLETMEDWDREATPHAHEAVRDGKMDLPLDDPRARRLQALQGYVMPLDLNVPELISPDNFFRKISSANAARRAKKQEKKMRKDRNEGLEKQTEEIKKRDKKLAELEKDLAKERRKLEKEVLKEKSERKVRKAEEDYRKEEAKILKDMAKERRECDKKVGKEGKKGKKKQSEVDEKEEKVANGIRWIVITRWAGDTSDDDDESLSSPSI